LWPERITRLAEFDYPTELNAAVLLLDENVRQGRGGRTAIFYKDQQITYAQLLERVQRLSQALKSSGIGKGDRVVLRFYNRPEFVVTWLALLRIGAVVVSTMPLLKARELAYIMSDSEAKAIVMHSELYDEAQKALSQVRTIETVIVAGAEISGCLSYEKLIADAKPLEVFERTTRADLAIIAYTSGSTAQPKGTAHFHDAILAIADSYARHILQPQETDVFGGHPTLAFTYGLGGMLVFPFRFGAATALLDKFTPENLLETIARHRVTAVFCTPTTYKLMLALEGKDVRQMTASLRLGISAGEHLPASVYKAWKDHTGIELLDGIGSTEMLHMFVSSAQGRVRPGSTGQPVPGYEVKIVNEDFQEVPNGQQGLIAIKGPTGCLYWRKPEQQKLYVRSGWNVPGDIFTKDDKGYYWYQCRNDDLIICGGYNIAGPEVESVLTEHPAVREVAVVASPDSLRGSIPKAFVILNEKYAPSDELAKELQDFVKQEIAPYKYPRKVEFLHSLPKTETGKIRRVELRERERTKSEERRAKGEE
jgi:2-aminobenzoate-CoA ligase